MRHFNRFSSSLVLALALLAAGMFATACQSSHEEGVKSDLHSQWTDVAAGTETTTEAARAVLEEQGLRDVKASSTKVDGSATAKTADGTKVNVAVKKQGERTSQVSVTVGTLGSPKLGAEIAKRIKTRAEGAPAEVTR
jgi:hypothetical protein